jgi:putative endonuclease
MIEISEHKNTFQKGREAETLARNFLINHSYKIIESNFYTFLGEIDVVAFDPVSKQFVFVEVKSLKNQFSKSIFQTVSNQKKRKIIGSAMYWLQKHDKINCDWRIDFIGIVLDNSNVVHLKAEIY